LLEERFHGGHGLPLLLDVLLHLGHLRDGLAKALSCRLIIKEVQSCLVFGNDLIITDKFAVDGSDLFLQALDTFEELSALRQPVLTDGVDVVMDLLELTDVRLVGSGQEGHLGLQVSHPLLHAGISITFGGGGNGVRSIDPR